MHAVGTEVGLPLTATFPCRASAGARPTRHEVTISADWSVRTPHDEDLERIAEAIGGGVSCLPALRRVLPGFRMWWERATRQTGLLARSPDRGASWFSLESALPCCPTRGFDDAAVAAAHCRGIPHVAAASRVNRRDLRALVAGLGPQADPGPPVGAGDPLVERAWDCGLHSSWVLELRAELAASGIPEPTPELMLALAHTGADVAWVASAARAVTDPSTAPWVAWTHTALDRREPVARRDWVATGSRRADIVSLSMSGYRAEEARAVAHHWGISVPGAAQLLGRWVRSGYHPSAAQLAWVAEEGVGFPPDPPAPSAVERVARALARRHPDTSERTELAIALARWGTVPDTVAVLRRGGQRALVLLAGDVGPPA
jgi:hypothetical protein